MSSEDTVRIMTRVNRLLSTVPKLLQNEDYKKIHKSVCEYLGKHCDHKIVRDYVDVDPERSWVVFYCIHCEATFSSETPNKDA
jgi:hypothetical protein